MTKIIPKVNETQEFIEIAFDFSNPLDLVREAISNSFDAGADKIKIGFETISDCGEKVLKIILAAILKKNLRKKNIIQELDLY